MKNPKLYDAGYIIGMIVGIIIMPFYLIYKRISGGKSDEGN